MMRTRNLLYAILFTTVALGLGCASSKTTAYVPAGDGLSPANREALDAPAARPPAAPATPLYLAYNFWYEKPDHLYSTGFHVGAMIPAGTQVANVTIGGGRNPWINFTTLPGGAQFRLEFVEKHHPGLTVHQYCQRMFTPKSFGELTEGFTEAEIQAVKEGQLKVGMSKRAVVVCWGYPPEVLTPTLQSDTWMFQENRFRKKPVSFSPEGISVRGPVGSPDAL